MLLLGEDAGLLWLLLVVASLLPCDGVRRFPIRAKMGDDASPKRWRGLGKRERSTECTISANDWRLDGDEDDVDDGTAAEAWVEVDVLEEEKEKEEKGEDEAAFLDFPVDADVAAV